MVFLSTPFSKTFSLPHWKAVLDPALALTPYGVPLAMGLGEVMELWIAREFWHILDNIHFYQQHPESLGAADALAEPTVQTTPENMVQALQAWTCARRTIAPVKLNLFWIGDKPSESFLPNHTHPSLIYEWEYLAASLDRHIQQDPIATTALTPVFRDTIALSVGLKSAFILTYQSAESRTVNAVPPNICKVLQEWGIACHQIDSLDPIAAIEREHLLWLMNAVGISKLIWSGLHLAILHLVFPSIEMLFFQENGLTKQPYKAETTGLTNLWKNTQGFWYWL